MFSNDRNITFFMVVTNSPEGLKTLLFLVSCHSSSVNGTLTLQTGEEAVCEDGWTVCSCFCVVKLYINLLPASLS